LETRHRFSRAREPVACFLLRRTGMSIAIVDVGKSNVKLLLLDDDNRALV
jgi:hypothetical protein